MLHPLSDPGIAGGGFASADPGCFPESLSTTVVTGASAELNAAGSAERCRNPGS
jgi:hypothetical protein